MLARPRKPPANGECRFGTQLQDSVSRGAPTRDSATRRPQIMKAPPLTSSVAPVTKPASALAR